MLTRRALESRMPTTISGVDISQADGVLRLGFGGGMTKAGADVSEHTVDGIPAVYTCIRILADAISQATPLLYRSLGPGKGREEATDNRMYEMLRYLVNEEMTAADWRDVMARSMLGWGDAFSEVIRDSQGMTVGLFPLHPAAMQIDRTPLGRKRYRYTLADGTVREWLYNPERPPIHHWMINSVDGVRGRSPVSILRESMGLAKAAEEFGARFFGSGSHPGGVLQADGKIPPDSAKRMREDWERLHAGLDRSNRIAVLDSGLKFQAISINPDDAQFLETRQFQDLQIAGVFGIPAFMINAASASNWGTGIESQKNALVSLTLRPHFERIQQAMKRDLLGRRDFKTYSVEFDTTELLQGDYSERMTGHATALNWHVKTLNEVRNEEGYNPVEGGDDPMPPLSTSSAGSSKDSTPDGGTAEGAPVVKEPVGASNG